MKHHSKVHSTNFFLIICLMGLVSMIGCTTLSKPDPWESLNRPIFQTNEALDSRILKPAAQAYVDYTPNVFRQSINNFFDNLSMPYSAVNNVLQLQFANAGKDIGRFLINSIMGIFGFFDVAGKLQIHSTHEDFGQTLAVWGVESGPYLMIPFYGPTTLRDLIAKLMFSSNPNTFAEIFTGAGSSRNTIQAFHAIRNRARYLRTDGIVRGLSIDKYIFYRTAYVNNRLNAVYNGVPPTSDLNEEDESWLDEE